MAYHHSRPNTEFDRGPASSSYRRLLSSHQDHNRRQRHTNHTASWYHYPASRRSQRDWDYNPLQDWETTTRQNNDSCSEDASPHPPQGNNTLTVLSPPDQQSYGTVDELPLTRQDFPGTPPPPQSDCGESLPTHSVTAPSLEPGQEDNPYDNPSSPSLTNTVGHNTVAGKTPKDSAQQQQQQHDEGHNNANSTPPTEADTLITVTQDPSTHMTHGAERESATETASCNTHGNTDDTNKSTEAQNKTPHSTTNTTHAAGTYADVLKSPPNRSTVATAVIPASRDRGESPKVSQPPRHTAGRSPLPPRSARPKKKTTTRSTSGSRSTRGRAQTASSGSSTRQTSLDTAWQSAKDTGQSR